MLRNPDQPGDSHRLMGRVGLRLPSTLLAIEVVAVGLLLVAVALAYLSHSIDMEYFYNSDQLYLPALFRDLLSEGGSYAEWNLTPAPYFFPDWPIYFAGYVVSGGSTYYATLVYALLQLGLTYVLLRAIYGELFEGNRRVYVSLACFGVLVATTLSGVSPIRISLVSARHWGDLLAGLLCIWLCLRILSHPRREGLYVAALGGAAFLAGISDAIHLAHFSLPLLLTAAYLLWRKQIQGRDFLRIGALPVIAAEIGSRLTTAVMPRRHVFKARFGFDDVSENLEEAWRVIERAVAHDPLTLALIPLFYAATIVFIVRYARNREPESLKPNFVTSFAFVSAAVWLGVALFALFVTDARYWAPGFTLPLLLFFAPAAGLARGAQITVAAGVLGAAALAFTAAEVIDNGFDLRGGYYPADVACLDSVLGARQLQYGYSDYWNAKRTTELSQRGLRVVSVHQQLGNYNWINSRAWFRPAYDFAIIDENAREGYRLRVDLIKETNGEPAFVEHCGSLTILGYGSNRLLAKP